MGNTTTLLQREKRKPGASHLSNYKVGGFEMITHTFRLLTLDPLALPKAPEVEPEDPKRACQGQASQGGEKGQPDRVSASVLLNVGVPRSWLSLVSAVGILNNDTTFLNGFCRKTCLPVSQGILNKANYLRLLCKLLSASSKQVVISVHSYFSLRISLEWAWPVGVRRLLSLSLS